MTPPAALAELLGREMEDDRVSISQSGNALRGASSGSEPSGAKRLLTANGDDRDDY
jgi:hypothetical protein